jgi:hypothetical protein
VFGVLTKHTNLLIQADLEAAGIEYRDGSDRVADFHALRHSFITALAMSKSPVKVIQSLARHSTPTLTLGIYAHVGIYDQTAALDALPVQPPATQPAAEPGTLAATGTDGLISRSLALHLPYAGDGSCRPETVPVVTDDARAGPSGTDLAGRNPLEIGPLDAGSRPLSASVGSGGGGIRTPGTLAGPTVFKTVPIGHSGTPPVFCGRVGVTGPPR